MSKDEMLLALKLMIRDDGRFRGVEISDDGDVILFSFGDDNQLWAVTPECVE